MTEDELFDLLTWIEEEVPLDEKPPRFETEAAALADGEPGRASLLAAAGEHWQMRGEYDEARRCFDEALADGGESAGGPLADLFSLALDRGDQMEASRRVEELRDLAKADAITAAERPRRRDLRGPRTPPRGHAVVHHSARLGRRRRAGPFLPHGAVASAS